MVMSEVHLIYLLKYFLLLLIVSLTQGGTSDDVGCLQTLKASISDPNGYLRSWDFTNAATEGDICGFNGIDCWRSGRVMNIQLSNMGLEGHFPSGLQLCGSLTGLNLSSNSFTGSIPENISEMVPFVTRLDLSYNSFSGQIPINLSACQYLNSINLQHNGLTGNIPGQLTFLMRLSTFDVASNLLTGPIPAFRAEFAAESYVNNSALCGPPLGACSTSEKITSDALGVIIATELGAIIGCWIGVALGSFLDCADRVTPWFYYYIILRKFTLHLFSACARDD